MTHAKFPKTAHSPRTLSTKSALAPIALIAPLVASFGVATASAGPAWAAPSSPDPYENVNRTFFNTEKHVDRAILRPLSVFYRHAFPNPLRAGLKRISANLGEPTVAVNDLLQGRSAKAGGSVVRFVANTTLGVGGVFDVASKVGLTHHDNDFGLTLARRGVGPGPYLFLPFLGPTNVRDGAGKLVSIALNPLTYVGYPGQAAVSVTTTTTGGLQTRADVDDQLKSLDASAVDPYATVRAFAQQRREADVRGGVLEVATLPDFDDGQPAQGPAVTKIAYMPAAQAGEP